VRLHAAVVAQQLLPGGSTDHSPDPTHGTSPKALKNLPEDVGLFSFTAKHLRLQHLDSRWITTPNKSSERPMRSNGTPWPNLGDFKCPIDSADRPLSSTRIYLGADARRN
jgi:hypothetical protein